MTVIKLNAGNDRNGNPRRVFVLISMNGSVHDAIDEGYDGAGRVYAKYAVSRYRTIPEFETTPREYRTLLRQFKDR